MRGGERVLCAGKCGAFVATDDAANGPCCCPAEYSPSHAHDPLPPLPPLPPSGSFNNVRYWVENIQKHANPQTRKMLLGNKIDAKGKKVRWCGRCWGGLGTAGPSTPPPALSFFPVSHSPHPLLTPRATD